MHIVFISGEYPLWTSGGVGTFIQTLGHALVDSGHEVSVVGIGKKTHEVTLEDKGIRIYRLKQNKSVLPNFVHNGIRINRKLKQLHIVQPISIIEAAEGGLAFLSRRHTARKVIRLHGGHHFFADAEKRGINWRKGWLEKKSFSKADGFIAVSKYVKEHTAHYLSYHGRPIEIISLPLHTNKEFPNVEVQENRILFAGTVCEKKGIRQLIRAFKLVRERFPEKELDIYGRDWFYPDGRSYTKVLKESYDASYFENVNFYGSISRDELDEKYTAAAFCVFPSHMETQGLVSIEAMLLGKLVIFTEYGPGPETIEHMKTGLLCDVHKPRDIAEKIIWSIENPDKTNEIGKRASEVVKEYYNAEMIAQKNMAFYESLLTKG